MLVYESILSCLEYPRDNARSCRHIFNSINCISGDEIGALTGTLKTLDWKRRDWKTLDLKSMKIATIFKMKSYGTEIKTVYGGMVATLKSSVPYVKACPLQH